MQGVTHGENIDIVNVATNAQQSRTVFSSKLRARLRSQCFKEFRPVIGATQTVFPHTSICASTPCMPQTSPGRG